MFRKAGFRVRSPIAPIYEVREKIRQLYAKYTLPVRFGLKFLAALFMLLAIHSKAGYVSALVSLPAVILIALVCCVMPWGMITGVMSLILLVHFMKVSFIVALVALVIMAVMVLMNLIFAPACRNVVFFVPLVFWLKVPFVLPLILGLLFSPSAALPMLFGLTLYYLMDYVSTTAGILSDITATTGMSARYMQLIDGLLGNRTFLIVAAAFLITVVMVFVIRRLSIDYAQMIAVVAGTVTNLVLVLFGVVSSAGTSGMSAVFVIVSSIISGLLAYLIQFMIFTVDYKRTEYTQFEDDEYYYYVKAVPKMKVVEKEYDMIRILDESSVGKEDSEFEDGQSAE